MDLIPRALSPGSSSAGGYLSSMMAVLADARSLDDLSLGNAEYSCVVQTAINWFEPTNFLKMDDQLAQNGLLGSEEFRHSNPNSPESLLLGEFITRIPDRVNAANPETYIGANIPPMLLQHERKDPIVPVQQLIEFYEKLKARCSDDRVTIEIFEDVEHGDPLFETVENVERVFRFLKAKKIYYFLG